MNNFSDGIVVVTGGAGPNIGSAISAGFAEAGAQVVILDVDTAAAGNTVETIESAGGTATFLECDVTDPSAVETTMEGLVAQFGSIDVLVNSAGGADGLRLEETDEETFHRNVEDNLKSAFFATKHALPGLRRNGGGSVVFVSTINALLGGFSEVAYAAANAGLHSLARSLTADHASEGVRFNVVCPGSVIGESETWKQREAAAPGTLDRIADLYPVGRYGNPADVADAVRFLASDRAAWISGVVLPVDGGLTATGGLPGGTWWERL